MLINLKPSSVSAEVDPNYNQACKSIAKQIQKEENISAKSVFKITKETSSKYHLSTLPRNENIIEYLPDDSHYRKVLMVKPTKTASGVVVIAVMPKPFGCPHGGCIYCPGGIEFNTP
ncbi:MAG TPA: hypothetical protein VFJ51_12555, partial [Nitrososphaeraceae archaeon]|nr:hypothetical protein [Nitrososphaeraceae archaeon]